MQLIFCLLLLIAGYSSGIRLVAYSGPFGNKESLEISCDGLVVFKQDSFEINSVQEETIFVDGLKCCFLHVSFLSRYSAGLGIDSYIILYGIYDNIVYKSERVVRAYEEATVSIYTPIQTSSEWSYHLSSTLTPSQWLSPSFVPDWRRFISMGANSTISGVGTQYYRRDFEGMNEMAAYEMRMYYRYGIIVYINGDEVFRDNMKSGIAFANTTSSRAYDSFSYRGFIRNGRDIKMGHNYVCIEMHFNLVDENHDLSMDSWLAEYSSDDGNECYRYNYPMSVKWDGVKDGSAFFDGDTGTIHELNSDTTFSLRFSNVTPFITSIGSYVDGNPCHYPVGYLVYEDLSGSYPIYLDVKNYTINAFNYYPVYLKSTMALRYIFSVITIQSDEKTYVRDLSIAVCNSDYAEKLHYEKSSITIVQYSHELNLIPVHASVYQCTTASPLPDGVFLSEAGTLFGYALTNGVFIIVVECNMPSYANTTIRLHVEACEELAIELRREYGSNRFDTDSAFIIDESNQKTILSFQSYVRMEKNMIVKKYLCIKGGKYRLEMHSSKYNYWERGSSIKIDLVLGDHKLYLFHGRYDALVGSPSSLLLPINILPSPIWYYHYESVPFEWYSAGTDDWKLGIMPEFPFSSNQIQLFKYLFTVSSDVRALMKEVMISVIFQYGCIVYLNNHLIYNMNLPPSINGSVVASMNENSRSVHTIVINYLWLIKESGPNVLAIGLIKDSVSHYESGFRATVHVLPHSFYWDTSYLFQFANGFTTHLPLPDDSQNPITSNTCDKKTFYYFCDLRLYVVFDYALLRLSLGDTAPPSSIRIIGRDQRDVDVDLVNEQLVWRPKETVKQIWLSNPGPYKRYTFSFNERQGESCAWSLAAIQLYRIDTALLYTMPFTFPLAHLISQNAYDVIPPSYPYFHDCTIASLPNNLTLNSKSCIIYGTPKETLDQNITYNALSKEASHVDGKSIITVKNCEWNEVIIRLEIHVGSNPELFHMVVVKSGAADVIERKVILHPGVDQVFDMCLKKNGIYTAVMHRVVNTVSVDFSTGNEDWTPASYYVSRIHQWMGKTCSFLMKSGNFGKSSIEHNIRFTTYFVCDDHSIWKMARDLSSVGSDWYMYDYNDDNWDSTMLEERETYPYITSYFRCKVVLPIMIMHTLRVSFYYAGGVVVYVGNQVHVISNLPNPYSSSSYGYAHDVTKPEHLVIHVNREFPDVYTIVICVEVHAPLGKLRSAYPILRVVSMVLPTDDSYYSNRVSSLFYSQEEAPRDFARDNVFDDDAGLYSILDASYGSYLQWSYYNILPIYPNHIRLVLGDVPRFGFTLYGQDTEKDKPTIWYSILSVSNQTSYNKEVHDYYLLHGSGGFNSFKLVFDVIDQVSSIRLYTIQFAYIPVHNEIVFCNRTEGFPSVSDGEFSAKRCNPSAFEGFEYLYCNRGVWQNDKMLSTCLLYPPSNLTYTSLHHLLYQGIFFYLAPPSYTSYVSKWSSRNLPEGLWLDEDGGISGIVMKSDLFNQTITTRIIGENKGGRVSTVVEFTVLKTYCKVEEGYESSDRYFMNRFAEINDYEHLLCYSHNRGFGLIRKQCIIRNNHAVWSYIEGICISPYSVAITMVIVTVLVSFSWYYILQGVTQKKKNHKMKPYKDYIVL